MAPLFGEQSGGVATALQIVAPASSTGSHLVALKGVNWFVLLGIVVVIVAVVAVTGIKPKGTRSVSHSRMMGMARIALVIFVVIVAYLAFRARTGG